MLNNRAAAIEAAKQKYSDKRICLKCTNYGSPGNLSTDGLSEHLGCTKHYTTQVNPVNGDVSVTFGDCFTINKDGRCPDHDDIYDKKNMHG